MKRLQEIWKAYFEANERLQERERRARSSKSKGVWRTRRDLNDQAYFVMLVARMEDVINEACDTLIARHAATAKGVRNRRAWQSFTGRKIEDLHFKNKLALLADKGRPDYEDAAETYDDRGKIAHGGPVGSMALSAQFSRVRTLIRSFRKASR